MLKTVLKTLKHKIAVPLFFKLNEKLQPFGFALSKDGTLYNVSKTMSAADRRNLISGHYEEAEIDILRDFKSDDTVIEIGAGIGVVSRRLLKKIKTGGTLVLVEANPEAFANLKKNMRRAAWRRRDVSLHFVHAAVRKPGVSRTTFLQCDHLSSGAAATTRDVTGDARRITVPSTSLSALMNTYARKGASLVADYEGGEYETVFDDTGALRHVRQLVLEIHGANIVKNRAETPDMLVSRLRNEGFMPGRVNLYTQYFTKQPGVARHAWAQRLRAA